MLNANNVMYCSDREQYRSIKADTEEDMNEMLRPSKQRAVVANAMFHKVLDNVGFLAKDYNLARFYSVLILCRVLYLAGVKIKGHSNHSQPNPDAGPDETPNLQLQHPYLPTYQMHVCS